MSTMIMTNGQTLTEIKKVVPQGPDFRDTFSMTWNTGFFDAIKYIKEKAVTIRQTVNDPESLKAIDQIIEYCQHLEKTAVHYQPTAIGQNPSSEIA